MTFLDDIAYQFGQITTAIQNSNVLDFAGLAIVFVLIGIAAILGFIAFAKTMKRYKDYVLPTGQKGTFKLSMRKESYITGNVNVNKSFLNHDVFERLKKQHPDVRAGILEIEEMYKQEIIYCYDMKVIDSFKSDVPDNNKILLISPVKLEDESVSWDDKKGDFSLAGSPTALFRHFPKNIQCSEFTEYRDVKDYHGFTKRVYFLAPYSDVQNTKLLINEKGKVVKSVLRGKEAYINIINFPQKEAIAKLAVFLPILTDLHEKLEEKDANVKALKEQIKELETEANDMNAELSGYKSMTRIHPFFGDEKPLLPIEPKSLMAMIVVGVVVGFAMAKLAAMDYFATMTGIEYLFLLSGIILVYALVKLFEGKTKEKFKAKTKENRN